MFLVVMRDLVLGTKVLDAAKRLKVPASMVDESVAPFAAKNATSPLENSFLCFSTPTLIFVSKVIIAPG